jgi:hypothetical protein
VNLRVVFFEIAGPIAIHCQGESAWLEESTCVAVGQLHSVLRFGLLATAAIVDMTSVVVATTAG